MEKLLQLCMGAFQDLYLMIAVNKMDAAKPDAKEALFRKLVAIFYGVSAMISELGYTEADVQKALNEVNVVTENKK